MLEIRAPPRSIITLPDSYRIKINQWKEQFVSDHHIIIYFHNIQREMEFLGHLRRIRKGIFLS